MEPDNESNKVNVSQNVAILIDGNNIERSLQSFTRDPNTMLNFDNVIPKLLVGRGLSRLIYFREGVTISDKLAERLLANYHGSVVPCHKSADIPLTIKATQIARKVDTIIILSGDSDYVELVRHLRNEGVRVEIAAIEKTTAAVLKEAADHFVPLTVEDSFIMPRKRNSRTSNSRSAGGSRGNSRSSSRGGSGSRSSSRSSAPRSEEKKDNSSRNNRNSSSTQRKSEETKSSSNQSSQGRGGSNQRKPAARNPQPRVKSTKSTAPVKPSKSQTPAPPPQAKKTNAPAKRGLFGWLKKS